MPAELDRAAEKVARAKAPISAIGGSAWVPPAAAAPRISASGTASSIEPAAMARPRPGVSLSLGWRTHSPHLLRFSADQRRSIRLIRLNAAAPASAAAPAIIAETAINAAEIR